MCCVHACKQVQYAFAMLCPVGMPGTLYPSCARPSCATAGARLVDGVQLTDSQLESQFSTGAEGVEALFSTLEGGTNLPLPPMLPNPVMPGDDIMARPRRKRHMFHTGNPLFQEEDSSDLPPQ